ncbi:MAG TPA: DUF1990 domain-containing protein [Natronosporangium sp.]|jgi:uncharacterized protein (UPF0548 family)|nr:DUF1990 domain-containing protein [Natronosporangium sp.]
MEQTFTYPEVGATAADQLPPGYRHLEHRVRLAGTDLAAAAEPLLTWRMHRAAGLRIAASAPRAAVGVQVRQVVGFGPIQIVAPCRVVWTVADLDRIGFGYGTLPGHPVSGEEAFLVSRDPDGALWFTVRAFSRPTRWFTRLAGPAGAVVQRVMARRYAAAMRRLTRAAHP